MSHEFESGFFVGEKAWHGLGTVLDQSPTMRDALSEAGLDWEVEERALFLGDGKPVDTRHKAIVRASDNRILGVVGPGYTPVQNWKALEPFQPLVDAGVVTLNAAGSLRNGARVWILGKIQKAEAEIVKGDAVKGYLLFYNGHDGSLAASFQETMIRVVCMNTLSAAVAMGDDGAEPRLKLRHTSGITEQIDAITERCARLARKFESTVALYRRLAEAPCGDPGRYFRETLRLSNSHGRVGDSSEPISPERQPSRPLGSLSAGEEEKAREKGKRQLKTLEELYETQPGAEYASGSYWQAYNAITYWIDHERGHSDEARLNTSWFGEGSRVRDRALVVAKRHLGL